MKDQPPKRRAILESVLSRKECLELIHIARCCSAVGYRDNCCAVTLTVIARICPQFLPRLASIRERIRDAVEQALGLELSLLIEFTGLVSWRPGASISWHTDSNKAYLTQRCAAAVVYLNESKHDFQGGNFKFRRGLSHKSGKETDGKTFEKRNSSPESLDVQSIQSIAPHPGLVVAYTTSEEHCVDPQITSGERFTLSMWFTTDIEHDEDPKLLATIKELDNVSSFNQKEPSTEERKNGVVDQSRLLETLPVAMHALPDGVDIRLCRLACFGICILKKREDRWVPLRSLEAGEWEREQSLQLGILVKLEDRVSVVISASSSDKGGRGGAIKTSVQQVIIAVQGRLLKTGKAAGCEKVCARHLNAFPEKPIDPLFQKKDLCCSWLDEFEERRVVQEVQRGGLISEVERLEDFIEAIRQHNDLKKPEEMRIWRETQEGWLKAGAVF